MNKPHGVCKNCQYWEPDLVAGKINTGYCQIFDKETTADHGAQCTFWTQNPPPGIFDEGRDEEVSEDMRREAIAGMKLIGEVLLFGIIVGAVVLTAAVLLCLYLHSSLYHPAVAP